MTRGTDVSEMRRKYRTANTGEFPDDLTLQLRKETDLRYGENPNQPAALYRNAGSVVPGLVEIHVLKYGEQKGTLSATNVMDITRALEVLKFFPDPAVAVMKHTVPSGFCSVGRVSEATSQLADLYVRARDADARSAFGSVVVFNVPVDKATAEALVSTFVEVVAAPDYRGDGAVDVLQTKGDLRAVSFGDISKLPKFIGDPTEGLYDLKALPTGRVIVQTPYLTSIRGKGDLVLDPLVKEVKIRKGGEVEYTGKASYVVRDPTSQELQDMLTAWYINVGAVRSNGIVIVKDGVTLAVGSGQQERVGAIEQAIVKAYQKAMDREKIEYDPLEGAAKRNMLKANPLEGAVVSSDAFYPQRDSIDVMARVGITATIQPGGSNKDYDVVNAANEHKMAMAFTLERCFGHF